MLAPAFHAAAEGTGSQSSASPVITGGQHNGAPGNNKAAQQNLTGPKHRKGPADTKLDADQARELYLRRKLRLEQIQAEKKELARDQRALATNRARLRAQLIETARALRQSEKRLTKIEEQLAQTRAKFKEQRTKLDEKSAQMSELFVLLQKMRRQPPPVMITHSKDALKMIRTGMVLAAFYADVERLAAEIAKEVEQLDRTEKEAGAQEQQRKAEQAQNSRLKTQIDVLLIENRKQLETTAQTLQHLDAAKQANLANLKTLEEMLPALEAASKKRNPAQEKGAGERQTAIPFASTQGLLPLPVQGRVVTRFGEPGTDGAPSKGLHIETRPSAQVVSPCDGLVLYAGQFRSYGQLLIIDPGGGYHVVIAGMDRIDVAQNQSILAGEPVATMGPETRSGETASVRPILYVEFRRDQQSIDPAPWWPAGGKG